MGFISNLFGGIFSNKPTNNDEITLIKFSDWIEIYNDKMPLNQSSMATALMVQGVNILVQNIDSEYSVLYSFIRNKKVTSKKIFDEVFIPFIINSKQNAHEEDHLSLMNMQARAAASYIIGSIYDSDPSFLFDFK
ncbi:hypothetical protein NAG84_13775 [Proteus terrae]|uniref:hypothetical protein n=1 Tax=Proteus terrae TaxID=1574161 RepID=UPI0020946FAE|nr:hypothetical protein [Proteus terrae]MCO7050916.1 hypothetical protein [Proteus terrae]